MLSEYSVIYKQKRGPATRYHKMIGEQALWFYTYFAFLIFSLL